MDLPPYPLEEVVGIKKKRVEAAEKVVHEREALLKKEEERLKEVEEERDKVKQHRDDKLQQLRCVMDEGTTTDKIQSMKRYLEKVAEDLAAEEEKVKKQEAEVEKAEKAVEDAKIDLSEKRKGVEKLNMHRKLWEKEVRQELQIIESREEDELGTIIYITNQRKQQGGG